MTNYATIRDPSWVAAIRNGHPLYWWHAAILKELGRLRDECETDGYNVKGLASNVDGLTVDTLRACKELEAANLIESCAPLWDYTEFPWYRLKREATVH